MHSNLICIQDDIWIFPYIHLQGYWKKVNLVQFYADLNIKHSCTWHLIVLLLKIFSWCLFKRLFVPAAVFTLFPVRIKIIIIIIIMMFKSYGPMQQCIVWIYNETLVTVSLHILALITPISFANQTTDSNPYPRVMANLPGTLVIGMQKYLLSHPECNAEIIIGDIFSTGT